MGTKWVIDATCLIKNTFADEEPAIICTKRQYHIWKHSAVVAGLNSSMCSITARSKEGFSKGFR